MARINNIQYNEELAHDALYDAMITAKCVIGMNKVGLIVNGCIVGIDKRKRRLKKEIYVPYTEKEEAKKFEAKWNPIKKTWYIPDDVNIQYFRK